ncbi:MAG: DUF3623 domain-containing protein [Pseudorhodoplanes sp.]|nr:DUF3623 domain-containing protein [Pseudorhodoplanes sp.]
MRFAIPALYALFLWWFSTGIILLAVRLPRRTNRASMAIAAALAIVSFYVLAVTRSGDAVPDAYLAFTAALLVWGFVELAFLAGYVTGPRKKTCPAGSTGWQRAGHATATIIHHELMLAAAGLAIAAITFGADNQVGTATFALLWVMRLSAKLNLFFGVRVRNADLLPDHLAHLHTYFGQKTINPLLPVSVALSLAATVALAGLALDSAATAFDTTAYVLLATLLVLAILEHVVMVIPIPVTDLWGWSLKKRPRPIGRNDGPADHSDALPAIPVQSAWPERAIADTIPITGRGA